MHYYKNDDSMNTLRWGVYAALLIAVLAGVVMFSYLPPANPRDGVVFVEGKSVTGSGIVIAPGVVLTAKHVTNAIGDTGMVVVVNGIPQIVTKVLPNPDNDATLLYANVACPCWRDITVPRIGEKVIAVGFPFGEKLRLQVLTEGTFEGFSTIDGIHVGITTASVEHGASGGAVFVERSDKLYLVGIVVLKLGANLSGFVPAVDLPLKEYFIVEK